MNAPPPTRFVKSNGAYIAYQVAGQGPPDLVAVLGTISSSIAWEEMIAMPFLARLSSFCKLLTFDQRGSGRSDPVSGNDVPTLEDRAADLGAVMDAAGFDTAALLGTHDGGAVSLMFTALHPERVSKLILANTWATLRRFEDYPFGHSDGVLEAGSQMHLESWGTGGTIDYLAPSVAANQGARAAWARHEQSTVSQGQAVALNQMVTRADARDKLSEISVPTLVLHAQDNMVVPIAHGTYLADHIAGARFVDYPSRDHLITIGDSSVVLSETEELLTGVRGGSNAQRVLATLLFTDVVGSTQRASELGDKSWRALLGSHNAIVRRELGRFGGRELNNAGDGFLAIFDSPSRAIECARAVNQSVGTIGLRLRIGIHAGECELLDEDITGMAVHIGARVAAHSDPGEVIVSSTVKDLVVGSDITFSDRGVWPLKGVPGEWHLFAVEG